jgi:hypothetical protein
VTARLIGAVLSVLAAGGCAAPLGPSIAHDETQLFRATHFDWARLKSGGIALLGVTSGVAPEGIREDVAFVLDQAASNHLSRVRVIPRSDAVARAREVGMGADLTRLMRDYDQTGTIDAGLLRRFAAVEGVRYFLLTRIVQYERTTRAMSDPATTAVTPGLAPAKRATERVQRIRLRGDVWDSRCGDLVWTGEGGTEVVEETATEDVRLQDVLAMAATNMVSLLPRSSDASQATGKECGA